MAGNGICRVCGAETGRPNGAYCAQHRRNKPKQDNGSKLEVETKTIDLTKDPNTPSPEPEPQKRVASKQEIDSVLVFMTGLALSGIDSFVVAMVVRPLVQAVNELSDDIESDTLKIKELKAAARLADLEKKEISKFVGGLLGETSIVDNVIVQYVALHPEAIPAMMAAASWGRRNFEIHNDIKNMVREFRAAKAPQEEGVRYGAVR